MREDDEIEAMRDEAVVRATEPSRFPGSTYEQGVSDALQWVTGDRDEPPLEVPE